MIKKLRVNNFALINQSEVVFRKKFTVVTGETGAGKSILLNALSIVLGTKPDVSVLYDKSTKAIIEAEFDINDYNLQSFFETNDLDYSPQTTLRREILPEGKTRAFINDTPVNISLLKQLGESLIDIHSQHENLLLQTPSFKYDFIDALANTLSYRKNYRELLKKYQKEKEELHTLIESRDNAKKEIDYYSFLAKEFQEVKLIAGELTKLEEESIQLENSENILQQISIIIQLLQENETNVIQSLHQVKNILYSLSKFNRSYEELQTRMQASINELKDIGLELEKKSTLTELNPKRLEQINTRLDDINKLLKKHQVKTDTELLEKQNEIELKLQSYQNIDADIEKKEKEVSKLNQELTQIAKTISEKRISNIQSIEQKIIDILKDLAMPNAVFKIEIQSVGELGHYGFDKIDFLFSANKGIAPTDLQKVASGGEIARLMLAIKAVMCEKKQLPSIIFDEIDTGISGSVAGKMGDIMKSMSQKMQVIVITHLPQIAGKGTEHFVVYKKEIKDKTISVIESLSENDRITEIAKMLSNGTPTDAAFQNARELLKVD